MSDGSRKPASKPRPKTAAKRKAATNGKRPSSARKSASSKASTRSPWIPASQSARKPAARAKAAKPRKASAAPRRPGQGLDVNDATFEQLREVGLSTGQSARLIEQRRLHGAFASVDDLAKVRGFSKRKIRDLGTKLQLGSGR
jgi:DNA uptake protein ComE-like DNA-binding protein